MQIRGAPALQLERGNLVGCLDQRKKSFEEEGLFDRRFAEAHGRETVIREMPARADQGQGGIDLQIGDRPLAICQRLQPRGQVRG